MLRGEEAFQFLAWHRGISKREVERGIRRTLSLRLKDLLGPETRVKKK